MLAQIIAGADGLEIGLVVVIAGAVWTARGAYATLNLRVSLLEQRLDGPEQSGVRPQDRA